MKIILRSALIVATATLLCACGAKGPLFMPEEAAPVEMLDDSEASMDADADPADADADTDPDSDVDEPAEGAADPTPPNVPA